MLIIGTEAADRYVIQNGKIFGSGISVKFTNIASVDVTGEAGDDTFIILSTTPDMIVKLYGALGSDEFVVTPRYVDPVVSRNFRGHRGIIEHELSSADPAYDGLAIRGVQADIMDNDGDLGYIMVVDQKDFHLMTEDGDGVFSFFVYPTRRPNGDVAVQISPPLDPNDEPYLTLSSSEQSNINQIIFQADAMAPQEITVAYNDDAAKLANTEMNLKITFEVRGTGDDDERFIDAEQSILPVQVRLIPHIDSAQAKSATIVEREGGTFVAEGQFGFGSSYEIYLRPCNAELLDVIELNVIPTVPNQLEFSNNTISGSDFNNSDCKTTISILAINDDLKEGEHYVSILHTIRHRNGEDILLDDGSPLLGGNILVTIYDDDTPGVIVQETNGITATAEIDTDGRTLVGDASFYEDEYYLRLTKSPAVGTDVSVYVEPIATASDQGGQSRVQMSVNGSGERGTVIVFTTTNWWEYVKVTVSAIDDLIAEGVDWMHFASQPSNLVSRCFFNSALNSRMLHRTDMLARFLFPRV